MINSNSSHTSVFIENRAIKLRAVKRIGFIGLIPLLSLAGLVLIFWLLGALSTFAQTAATSGTIRYVSPNGSDISACTVGSPCKTIQHAMGLSLAGDEVRVAGGLYTGIGSYPVITVTKSITISGGYDAADLTKAADPLVHETILDGELSGRVVLITGTVSPIIEGFTIRNGSASTGAGIYNHNGTPTIRNNRVHNNQALTNPFNGGGIYDGGFATIEDNEIYQNKAGFGAGVQVNNSLSGTTTIRFNEIYSNTAAGSGSESGGGILLNFNSSAFIEGNHIYKNRADFGGGLLLAGGAVATLQSNMLYQNTAAGFSSIGGLGGGVLINGGGTLRNNTIVSNVASAANSIGGGIFIASGATAGVTNTIVASNTASIDSGVHLDINVGSVFGTNNNIFNNQENAGGSFANTTTTNPGFINPALFNLRLSPTSLNIDAGAATVGTLDIDKQGRVNGSIDVGADEYYANSPNLTLKPDLQARLINRGQDVTYTHALENIGTVSDSYTITCSHNRPSWTVTCPSSPVALTFGGRVNLNTVIRAPSGEAPYTVGTTIITATSTVNSSVTTRAVIRSTVSPIPGVSFTPSFSSTLLPGEIVTFTHVLMNTGNATDDFLVELSSDSLGWATLLPSDPYIVTLNAGESQNIQVQVDVPPFAEAGIANLTFIQASSQFDPSVKDVVSDTVTAKATVGTRYVSATGGSTDSRNNCTQYTTPCRTIAHAVSQATFMDEVRIAAGNYVETNKIDISDQIFISGGWNVADFTIQGGPGTTTISRNNARLLEVVPGVDPVISNLTLWKSGNLNIFGGAVFVGNSASPRFSDLIIQENQGSNGGAMFVDTGALVRVSKTRFVTNTAQFSGGSIYVNGGTVQVDQSRFAGNQANAGGAVIVNSGSAVLRNDLFYINTAANNGGAASALAGFMTVDSVTFVDNDATGNGRDIYNGGATVSIANAIFADQSGTKGGVAIFQNSGNTTMNYSDVWPGGAAQTSPGTIFAPAAGNLDVDPGFAPGDDKFHITLTSGVLDMGSTTLNTDFEDDFRPSDQGDDIGYDELTGCSAKRGGVIYGSIQDAVNAGGPDNMILVAGTCRGTHPLPGAPSLQQTVHLTQGVMITLTIQGGWLGDFSRQTNQPTLVDPEGNGRGFYISGNISPTIESITIVNGDATNQGGGPTGSEDAGGGIYNVDSQLALNAVSIYSSTAEVGGGFYNDMGTTSMMPLSSTVQSGQRPARLGEIMANQAITGGGVYNNDGTLIVDSVLVHNNSAGDGGGIYNSRFMTATNTVVYENAAAPGNGGGVYNNSTGLASFLHLTVYSNTASLSGGGFYNRLGAPFIRNSIFQGNRANASGPAIHSAVTTPAARINYNYYHDYLIPPAVNVFGTVITGVNSIASNSVPPGMKSPHTGDFHLLEGTSAVDAASPSSPIGHDYDGDLRPSNQGFDMGADELVGCLARVNSVIYGNIQLALAAANPGDQIDVAGRCTGVHPYSTGGSLGIIDQTVHINKDIVLVGGWNPSFSNQNAVTLLDAQGLGRAIYIAPNLDVTIDSFDITGGDAFATGSNNNGGAIYVDSNAAVTILNNRIYSNTASLGAAIYNDSSSLLVDGGNRLYFNQATSNGGAVYLANSAGITATVQNNFIYRNSAVNGAALYSAGGNNLLWHNTIFSNTATSNGGGFYIAANSPDIRGNIFMSNTAATAGSVYRQSGSLTMDYNDFFGNGNDFGGTISNGPNDLAVNPNFMNVAAYDFTLDFSSSVVDRGDPTLPLLADFEADIRPSHQGFDIGADEVGGCYAYLQSRSASNIYGSVQLAVDLALISDTVYVNGVCMGVNTRFNGSTNVAQTLYISKPVTLDGSWNYLVSPPAVLDPVGRGRALYVDNSTIVTVTNFAFINGDATSAGITNGGGAVYNQGDLRLSSSIMQDNTAALGGAFYNAGDLDLRTTSFFSNTATNGGAFYNSITVGGLQSTLEQNRFNTNQAVNGGAIYQNTGPLFINGNDIYRNSTTNGGGIYLFNGDGVDVRNNFIYKNLAAKNALGRGGGLYSSGGSANIWHNTFYRNVAAESLGTGIYLSGNASNIPGIYNNIVEGNNSGTGIHALAGSNPKVDYNNAINNTVNYVVLSGLGANNMSVAPILYEDRLMDDYHLRDTSPGVDQGQGVPTVTVPFDYDGDVRPTNGAPDIGADEVNTCIIRVGTQIFGELQAAINYAESNSIMQVEMARGVCSGVKLISGTLQVGYVTKDLQFTGSLIPGTFNDPGDFANYGAVSTRIDALHGGRVIYVAPGANPTFTEIAFTNGDATPVGVDPSSDDGGAIYNPGNGFPQFINSFICENHADKGGAYYGGLNSNVDFTGGVTGLCTVIRKFVDLPGIGTVPVFDYFTGNTAVSDGGAVFVDNGGLFEVRNHGYYSNTAGIDGGGVYIAGKGRLINGIFYDNFAQGDGGGVFNGGDLGVYHNTIRDNRAGDNGGGVYNISAGSAFTINSSIIYTNTTVAVTGTGGIHSVGGFGQSSYNNIYDNSVPEANIATTNVYTWEPGLLGVWSLSVHSNNIDKADPALLAGPDPLIDYDAEPETRPDGNASPPTALFSDVGADEYFKDFGCDILPNPISDKIAVPGQTLTYTFRVYNSGFPSYVKVPPPAFTNGYTDTITITLKSQTMNWGTLQNDGLSVVIGWDDAPNYGGFVQRVLTVTVPTTATLSSHRAVVECRSSTLPTRATVRTIQTVVGQSPRVDVEPDRPSEMAFPGDVITYVHTVTNIGNEAGTFQVTSSPGSQGYATAAIVDAMGNVITPVVDLNPSETITVLLRVRILGTAVAGDVATPAAIAFLISDPSIFDNATNSILIGFTSGTRYVANNVGADDTNCTDSRSPCATIQYALNQAVANDEILVSTGIYTDVVTRTVGAAQSLQNIYIDKSVAIRGGYNAADGFTSIQPITNAVFLDGQNSRRVISITTGLNVTLTNLFIQNGQASAGISPQYGGGVYNAGANLVFEGAWFLSNTAQFGAGLYHQAGTLGVHSSVFDSNQPGGVDGDGAGLYMANGVGQVENNTFVNNTAGTTSGRGGAVYADNGSITAVNNIFNGNNAFDGSAIFVNNASVSLTNDYNLYNSNPAPIINLPNTLGPNSISGQSPLFVDAYYHIDGNSPAFDTGTTSLALTQFINGFDYDAQARKQGVGVDIGADEFTQVPDFSFTPVFQTVTIFSGDLYTYTHVLANIGDYVDSYTLTMANVSVPPGGGWGYAFTPQNISNLNPGQSVTVTLVITGGAPGFVNTTTLTATAASGVVNSVVDVTTITQTHGVDIEKPETGSGVPGQSVVYTHVLTNTGDGPDRYTLTPISSVPPGWNITVVPTTTGLLLTSETIPFTVTVQVPNNALSGTLHTVMIEAVVVGMPSTSDTLIDSTTVLAAYGVDLTPDWSSFAPDNVSIVYTHTLTNLGNAPDTIDLSVTATNRPSWVVTINPPTISLGAFQTAVISVTVNVPPGTLGQVHTVEVTAQSVNDLSAQSKIVDTTTVASRPWLDISPPTRSSTAGAGAIVNYNHTVTNVGNAGDTFNITLVSSRGWPVNVTPSTIVLAPGASTQITVTVNVPVGAANNDLDVTEITVRSQTFPVIFDKATDSTLVSGVPINLGVSIQPNRSSNSIAGSSVRFAHTILNTGTVADTYLLSLNSSQGWSVSINRTTISLNPGQSALVTVTVNIPGAAVTGTVDVTTVTATSMANSAVSDTATDTTTVGRTFIYVPIIFNRWTNTPPVAAGDSYNTFQNTPLNVPAPGVLANDTDVDGDLLTAVLNTSVSHGTLTLNPAGSFTYNPTSGYVGPDSFTYRANDGKANSGVATVNITVMAGVNSPPVANNDTYNTPKNVTLNVPATGVLANDTDPNGNPLTAVLNTNVSNGTLILNANGSFAYTPNSGFTGSDSFTYFANDGSANSATAATVQINVANTAPVANIDNYTTLPDTPLTVPAAGVLANDTDANGDPLTAVLDTGVSNGSLTFNLNGSFIYTPTTGYSGPDSFTYHANDGTTNSNTVTVNILVTSTPCTPTNVDLIVTMIQVSPNPPMFGQPTTISVTIRNQGSTSVTPGNNFYLDFYIDRTPAPFLIGDFVWGIQGADLAAGTSRTYTGTWGFTPGTHNLYAQVDTDNTVDECPNENNNTLGPVPIVVTFLRQGNFVSTPFAGEPSTGPRSTPTPIPLTEDGVPPIPMETPVPDNNPVVLPTPIGQPSEDP